MQPERWKRIKDIFHSALECDASTRQAFLEHACAHDAELRAEVDSLLAAHEASKDFIDQPAVYAALGDDFKAL
jgi:eukaryotic-like serine/threonine-protein kinase